MNSEPTATTTKYKVTPRYTVDNKTVLSPTTEKKIVTTDATKPTKVKPF